MGRFFSTGPEDHLLLFQPLYQNESIEDSDEFI